MDEICIYCYNGYFLYQNKCIGKVYWLNPALPSCGECINDNYSVSYGTCLPNYCT